MFHTEVTANERRLRDASRERTKMERDWGRSWDSSRDKIQKHGHFSVAQTMRIRNLHQSNDVSKFAAFKQLLEDEIKLINEIRAKRQKLLSGQQNKKVEKILDRLGAPVKWVGYKSKNRSPFIALERTNCGEWVVTTPEQISTAKWICCERRKRVSWLLCIDNWRRRWKKIIESNSSRDWVMCWRGKRLQLFWMRWISLLPTRVTYCFWYSHKFVWI